MSNKAAEQHPYLILTPHNISLSTSKGARKQITVSGITDMEDNPASIPVVKALASRIHGVVKEMGLSASVTVGGGNHRGNQGRNRQEGRPRVILNGSEVA